MNLDKALQKGLDRDGSLGLAFHHAIQSMSFDEMKTSAQKLADLFYTVNQVNNFRKVRHEKHALVIRTIFGDLSRNGLILDETHPDRKNDIKRNKSWINKDWQQAFAFCDVLASEFESRGNSYGVMLIAEMVAHRYGDLALVGFDTVDDMEQLYRKAYKIATEIQCQKQMFSPWYWGAFYFMKLGQNDKSIEWFRKFTQMANKYMKDQQPSYREMVCHSLRAIKKMMPKQEWEKYKSWFNASVQNKQMVRAFRSFKG